MSRRMMPLVLKRIDVVPGAPVPLPNPPQPRADELLYSLVARIAVHIGHWSPKGLVGALYGDRGTLAVPDVPSSLGLVDHVCRAAWDMSLEEMVLGHTLFPFFTHFLPADQRAAAMRRMLHRREYLHMRLGICSSGVRRTGYFRLCPSCTRDDLQRHGETYWRRIHHLPGSLVCAVHGDPLLKTCVPYRPIGRHEHIAAHPKLLAEAIPVLPALGASEVAFALASRSAALLEGGEWPGTMDYRSLLRLHGFVGKRGGSSRLEAAVREVIPTALLSAMFNTNAGGLSRWLDTLRRKPRRTLHPLKHVVIQFVLDALSKSAAPAPAMMPPRSRDGTDRTIARSRALELAATGLSTRAMARNLGIAWKTADRLIKSPPRQRGSVARAADVAADRAAWTALRESLPAATRTELRREGRALYMRLYRSDRPWLLSQPCARYPRKPVQRIDWVARDRELASRAAVVAQAIRSRTPAIRASRSRVLGELQIRTLVAIRAAKLPQTLAVLAKECETVETFQVRRLLSAMKARAAQALSLSDWALLRAARINPDRFADGGAALIEAARRAWA